jgi:hypothetical protein
MAVQSPTRSARSVLRAVKWPLGVAVILSCFAIVLFKYGILLTALFGLFGVAAWRAAGRAPRVHKPHTR